MDRSSCYLNHTLSISVLVRYLGGSLFTFFGVLRSLHEKWKPFIAAAAYIVRVASAFRTSEDAEEGGMDGAKR